MEPSLLKKLTITHQKGQIVGVENLPIVLDFVNYISAFCADLKFSEDDVLHNDEHFNMVYHLFEQNVLTKKYQIHE
jgi:hypothetical protein